MEPAADLDMDIDAALLRPAEPQYGSASIADIMPSAMAVLGVPGEPDRLGLVPELPGVRRVAILLIDGLGYHLYPRAARVSPILAEAVAQTTGRLRRLTTNFPSTTPTSLVSLGTGTPPGRHGVLGFTVNIPDTDELLTHIMWGSHPDPSEWQPVTGCFSRAVADGVTGVNVSPVYPSVGLSQAAFQDSRRISADTVPQLAAGVREGLASGDRSLVYGYFPAVDKMGHEFGVGGAQWKGAVAQVDQLLRLLITDLPADTALMVTADHGMVNVADEAKIDVAAHPQLRDGVRLIAGEPRVRYVHTLPGATEEVAATWRRFLGDRAEVWTREEAIAQGWFGPVAAAHAARIGDLVVACRDRYVLVGVPECDTPATARLRGYHGSLTEMEMAIPLWIYRGTA